VPPDGVASGSKVANVTLQLVHQALLDGHASKRVRAIWARAKTRSTDIFWHQRPLYSARGGALINEKKMERLVVGDDGTAKLNSPFGKTAHAPTAGREVCPQPKVAHHFSSKCATLLRPMSYFRAALFKGQSAVVTGGGSGIGFAVARELSALGASVVLAGRNEEKLAQAVSALTKDRPADADGAVAHRVCNIREEEQVRGLMEFAVQAHGALDLLVCNAGGQFPAPVSMIKKKGWDAVIETNLTGTFLCCREAHVAGLKTSHTGGAIVNIIADMFNGFPGMGHTGAARSAVDNLTKTLALEWAVDGVRVNAVAPGVIYSDTAAANYPPGFMESVAPELPPHRLGTPEEVSAAVCFLLSPAARYISGDTLRVDGGSSLYGHAHFKIPPHNSLPALQPP
jgi:peroxisomal trans-2-enoyl-CoA reductase